MLSYMESNALIHLAQSGFRPHHSTQDVLVKTVDNWRKAELMWFENYLRGRKQRVVACDGKSVWSSIGRGVPQGSILGLLLFNDLPTVVKQCTVNLYADETTLYCCYRDPQEVKYALEADLEAVANWIDVNNLKMNIGKTQLMVLYRNRCV